MFKRSISNIPKKSVKQTKEFGQSRLKTKGWTLERRKAQATRIRAAQPWRRSTGPRTPAGKARCAQNAFKHGIYSRVGRELKRTLWQMARFRRAAAEYRRAERRALQSGLPVQVPESLQVFLKNPKRDAPDFLQE